MEHKIINGDCIIELDKIQSDSVDMVLTDPPFNIRKKYNSYKDNIKHKDYLSWCQAWILKCIRVMKPGASLYLINYPENNAYLMPFLDEHLTFKRWLTWHYPTNTGMSPTNYTRSQHSILFYIKGEKSNTFNRNDIAEPYRNLTDIRIKERIKNGSKGKTPYDVFQFNIVKNVSKEKIDHPCQIPISLLSIFIKASSNLGDTILDPFGGSFSTASACKQLGRNSISIEIDKKYCENGKTRLSQIQYLDTSVAISSDETLFNEDETF
jgi:DNA modification methylase